MVVWSTGLAPRDFVKSLDVDKNQQGQVIDTSIINL
jgi:NADH dehydrogenase FAD-containing subunit